MRILDTVIASLGDVVSPRRCAACDAFIHGRSLLCTGCAATVVRWERGGQPWALGHYGGALASLLLRLKYGKRPDLAPPIGQLLADVVCRHVAHGDVDLVVPVPVPYKRLVDRGYNQAALIARPVASRLSSRFAPLALTRQDGSVKQAALNREQRLQNLHGAFTVRTPRAVESKRVLLIDDISTTGATLAACVAALDSAGARDIRCAVVARTENPDAT